MKISENFDRWMFDYKEGNLSAKDAEEFENFLLNNPEFEVDADAWDMAFILDTPTEYPFADKLEKKRRVAGWYYWSAAAMLLLLIGSTTIFVFSDTMENSISGAKQSFNVDLKSSNHYNALNTRLNLLSSNIQGETQFFDDQNHFESSYAENYNDESDFYSPQDQNEIVLVNDNHSNAILTGLSVGKTNEGNVLIEQQKLSGQGSVAKYQGNPESKSLAFNVNSKTNYKSGYSRGGLKKMYNRFERMLKYPVGLTNLRDPELIIPQNTLLAYNSAFTGGMLKARFEMNYRNQWTGSDFNSQELNISYDNYSNSLRGGIGFLVNAQDYGFGQFGDYNISLLYSPKMVVSRNIVIEPAVKMTLGSIVANGNSLIASSNIEMDRGRILQMGNETQLNGLSRQWYKDYGLGVMINTKWFYAGINADNLGRHYENVYGNELSSPSKSPVRLTAVAGFDYLSGTRKNMTLSPFVAYQQLGSYSELWSGVNYRAGWFTIGASASTRKEFTASVGMKFDKFKLVYSYDHTESMLTNQRFGSHNIGIRFNADRKNHRLTH